MLDPSVCASMTIGAPQVSLPALSELHHLLLKIRIQAKLPRRRSRRGGASNEGTHRPILKSKLPRQLAMALIANERDQHHQRNAVISRLALMLMEAAGIQTEKTGDDGR